MRKPLLIAGGLAVLAVLAVVAIVVVQLLRSDDPNLATEAPLIPVTNSSPSALALVTATPAASATSAAGASSSTVALPPGVRRFSIVAAQSSAKYVVRESLRGIQTTAVGTSKLISGDMYLTKDGLYRDARSSFQVDLRGLQSDEGQRDNFIRQNTLQTARFPFATFVVESVTGFPASYTEDTQVELTLTGTMTIRDVSKPMTFKVLARQKGNTFTATADADFNMTDFNIQPPDVQIAKAENGVHLQIILVAVEPS